MTVCPRCGTLTVGRDQDKDEMRERIAELESEIERLQETTIFKELVAYKEIAEQHIDEAEAEVERLKRQRCTTCNSSEDGHGRYCLLYEIRTSDGFGCTEWAEKGDK